MAPSYGNVKSCYVEIPAADVARSIEFYQAVFGWNVGRRGQPKDAYANYQAHRYQTRGSINVVESQMRLRQWRHHMVMGRFVMSRFRPRMSHGPSSFIRRCLGGMCGGAGMDRRLLMTVW